MRQHSAAPVPFGWRRAADAGLTFRPATDADLPFLIAVFASTRAKELAMVPWSEAEKTAFVDMQFRAQHTHYQRHHSGADRLVTMRAGEAIGRLYLERTPHEHCIIDITFLPQHRGQGLGAALLKDLQDEAAAAGKAVEIHVEKFNPAMQLYCRLGFRTEEDLGVYQRMRWNAVR
jgi:GNAT superfamily N-acetyltransferase